MSDALKEEHRGLQVYLGERNSLIAIACRIVESRAIAEELVQDSWFRWDKKEYSPEKAKPIFRSIVLNLARDWKRRQQLETAILEAIPHIERDTRDAERIVIARQEIKKMIKALEELEPRVVTAFRLHRLEGLSMAEIAERLDTVPSRIHAYLVKAITHITLRLIE